MPKGINIIKRKEDGSILTKITNGSIIVGTFTKPDIAGVVHKAWFQNGSKSTQSFIDDIQRMVLQWLMRYGFTVSISHTIVPKKIHNNLRKIIETVRIETLSMITQYENDPYVMTAEAFEINLQKKLEAIITDVQEVLVKSLSPDNGIYITTTSGSSGAGVNVAQIIGCVGQVIDDESKRIQLKFNGRSFPTFYKHDNSAFARGFCHNSFVSGLSPVEYFYQAIAGRDGNINTAIKTADTGYVQRKLIKMMEDIRVEYDGTVRNANGKIIQCVYGDNSVNTEKQIEQKIGLMSAGNATIREKYLYSTTELKKLTDTKYTDEINETLYKKLIAMRDQMRRIQRLTNLSAVVFRESFMMPVDIQQYVNNITNRAERKKKGIVDPYYVLLHIRNMYTNHKIMKYNKTSVIKRLDEKHAKLLLKFYLYDILVPKKCTHLYQLTTVEFDEIEQYFTKSMGLAKVEGGEMCGLVGAQSIGEPVTQTNLKSFHKAGLVKLFHLVYLESKNYPVFHVISKHPP